jgi:hypothetical protein
MSVTCPCSGFAYGEKGKLALERLLDGRRVERLDLTPYFVQNQDVTGFDAAVVRRWDPEFGRDGRGSDLARYEDGDPRWEAEIRARPLARVMRLGDYTHDGWATKFLLQVSTMPCGKHQMILIGLSREEPHLHVFSTDERPGIPLVMGAWEWDALLQSQSGRVSVTDWACDDHGSDTEDRIDLRALDGKLHARDSRYSCGQGGRPKGTLLETFDR